MEGGLVYKTKSQSDVMLGCEGEFCTFLGFTMTTVCTYVYLLLCNIVSFFNLSQNDRNRLKKSITFFSIIFYLFEHKFHC